MTLRQTIQAAPAKTTELITKLSATSNQALKTRESLFAQLSDELTRYVELEEQHFLPLLRKHSETKGLAADALKGNKEMRASLEKLSAMPKVSGAASRRRDQRPCRQRLETAGRSGDRDEDVDLSDELGTPAPRVVGQLSFRGQQREAL